LEIMGHERIRPQLIAHADWSVRGEKRMLSLAVRQSDGRYSLDTPRLAGNPQTLLMELSRLGGADGAVLVGFDFPIGLPIKYARRAGLGDFITALPALGGSHWPEFYQVAETREQINLGRPFYPARPGGARLKHLLDGLGLEVPDDLRRQCEKGGVGRRAAAPLFWTMGAQQVGKAAIHGWQSMLAPGLEDLDLDMAIWPFQGRFWDLVDRGGVVVVETYPAEYYSALGVRFGSAAAGKARGKRNPEDRRANAPALLAAARAGGAVVSPDLANALLAGFGKAASGEDAFDSLVGLVALLWAVKGRLDVIEPEQPSLRAVEGWIMGRENFG
jgi:hypothetical protein